RTALLSFAIPEAEAGSRAAAGPSEDGMRQKKSVPILLAAFALLIARIGLAAEPSKSSAIVSNAADDYWAFVQREKLNIRVHEGLPIEPLPDISLEHLRANADFGRLLQKRLSVVTENELSHEAQLTAAILREEARVLVDAPDRYWLTFPETPYAFQFLGV